MEADFVKAFLQFQGDSPLCKHFQDDFLATLMGTNSTQSPKTFATDTSPPYSQRWYAVLIPLICVFGLVGNALNLVILTRRRLLSRMEVLEKSATFGLVALAFSDMMFCIAVLPHAFVNVNTLTSTSHGVYQLYYRLYGVGLINLFLMTSTWLIVYMAISRYIVVVYPFQARWTLGYKKAMLAIAFVMVFSLACTIPFFIHVRVQQCMSLEQEVMYEYQSLWSSNIEASLQLYMRWVWPILADFIPLAVLAFLNWRLIRELRTATRRRRSTCRGQVVQESSQRVTLTLVVIVVMLLLFVSPSEILRYFNPYKSLGKAGHTISIITNICQTVNFAFNFVLYCAVSESFRITAKALVICRPKNSSTYETYSLTTVYTMRQMSAERKNSRYLAFL